MLAIRSHPLVGERCPICGLADDAKNRNKCGVYRNCPAQVQAGWSRTVQERAGLVGTYLTREIEILVRGVFA